MASLRIVFEPVGRRGECHSGQSLLECARQSGINLVSLCGGNGTCEHCKVQVYSGKVTELTADEKSILSQEEIDQGYRLACQTFPNSDLQLHVPFESLSANQRAQVEGLDINVKPDGVVLCIGIQGVAPSMTNPVSDEQSLRNAVFQHSDVHFNNIDLQIQRELSFRLREMNWRLNVAIRKGEVIALLPYGSGAVGLAVDLGTTKIAAYLVDLENGRTLASKGLMNPQISFGEDVVARIAAANQSAGNAAKLNSMLVESLNLVASDLCSEIGMDPTQIVEAVLVGNTAMHHFFLGLPVTQLGAAPYVPAVHSAVDVKSREIGLRMAPGAYVHLLPNIAGFVGADHTAMILASGINEMNGIVLGIDIGTNTEICLNQRGKLTSLSCASGPAFEGAHIKHGMRAASGAIEHARFNNGRLQWQTIDNAPPIGICGSGLLDLVAELVRMEVLDHKGRMLERDGIRDFEGLREFVLVAGDESQGKTAISISQKDVRELQLAKAAIQVGVETLLEANDLRENEIEQVIIAGAFGSYLDIASAIAIGMLPDLPLHRFKQVGNAAGSGARMALLSNQKRVEAQRLAEQVGYIELASVPGFQEKFTKATYLK